MKRVYRRAQLLTTSAEYRSAGGDDGLPIAEPPDFAAPLHRVVRASVTPHWSGGLVFPFPGTNRERFNVIGPIVQCRRIEVCAIWPNQSVNLSIDVDQIEQFEVTKWPKQLAAENRSEIDDLFRGVFKRHA